MSVSSVPDTVATSVMTASATRTSRLPRTAASTSRTGAGLEPDPEAGASRPATVRSVVAGHGCTSVSAHIATCPAAGVGELLMGMGRDNDRVILGSALALASIVVHGGGGNDRIVSEQPAMHAFGDAGADLLRGSPFLKGDVLYGGAGDDVLRGSNGPDILIGNHGDDRLSGGVGADDLIGGRGDDSLQGKVGNDALHGSPGDDTLVDVAGDDSLFGGADPDLLDARDGEPGDFLDGGPGPDFACRASFGDAVVRCK